MTAAELWGGFVLLAFALIALDLLVLSRGEKEVGVKKALGLSAFWISLSALFAGGVHEFLGADAAAAWVSCYLLEKALSVDNLFVFIMIFAYFKTPAHLQHKVLTWGILGVLFFRGILIYAGAALVTEFHWLLYGFGAFLIFTAIKLALAGNEESEDLGENKVIKFLQRVLPVSTTYQRRATFFVRQETRASVRDGQPTKVKIFITPLFLTLVTVEIMDVLFALDSIPAAFGVTTDAFLIYSSNLFAVLGLRALYFVVAAGMREMRFLQPAVAAVLGFIGMKLVAEPWVHITTTQSLLAIGGMLAVGIIASLTIKEKTA